MKLHRNPYLWILAIPLVSFVTLAVMAFPPDFISVPVRTFIFFMLAYVTSRYAGRSPRLIWESNTSPEGRNIVGFGMFLVAQMLSQAYSIVYILTDRPDWLANAYYAPAFVTLGAVGLALVASSVPRFPFPPFTSPKGLSVFMSLMMAVISTGILFVVAHFPIAAKFIGWFFGALSHAV